MAITPFQLPNPREDTPASEDIEAMRLLGDPYTSGRGNALLNELESRHRLQREQYQNYLGQAQDLGRQTLDAQRFEVGTGAIHNLLQDPNGFNVLMGIPEARRIMSGLSPDAAGAIGHQSFSTQQAKIIKDLGDAWEKFAAGGGQPDPEQLKKLLGMAVNAQDPTSVAVERLRGQSALDVENAKLQKPPGVNIGVPPQPGFGNESGTTSVKPGQTPADRRKELEAQGWIFPADPSLPPRPPPGKTGLKPNPAATKQPTGGNPLLTPALADENANKGEAGIQPPGAADLVEDTKRFTAAWQAGLTGAGGKLPPEIQQNVNEYIRQKGQAGVSRDHQFIYGIARDGGYVKYPMSALQ